MSRLNDLIDTEADIAALAAAAARSGDPVQVAGLPAKITRSILEHCGDIIHALVTGAAAEPDLAVVLAEGHRRHVEGARRVVGLLQDMHALAPSVDADEAVDTISAISDTQVALLLRDSYGWSLDRVESWIASTSRALVLAPT